jgi:hypothetical protein
MSADEAGSKVAAIRSLVRRYESGLHDFVTVPQLSVSDYFRTTAQIIVWELSCIASLLAIPILACYLIYWLIKKFAFGRKTNLLAGIFLRTLAGMVLSAITPFIYVWKGEFALKIIRVRYLIKWLYFVRTQSRVGALKEQLVELRLRALTRAWINRRYCCSNPAKDG